jgi:hypothetical protein
MRLERHQRLSRYQSLWDLFGCTRMTRKLLQHAQAVVRVEKVADPYNEEEYYGGTAPHRWCWKHDVAFLRIHGVCRSDTCEG